MKKERPVLARREMSDIIIDPRERRTERTRIPIQKKRSKEIDAMVGVVEEVLEVNVVVEWELRVCFVALKFVGWRRLDDIRV
jgi:hypothetical protein